MSLLDIPIKCKKCGAESTAIESAFSEARWSPTLDLCGACAPPQPTNEKEARARGAEIAAAWDGKNPRHRPRTGVCESCFQEKVECSFCRFASDIGMGLCFDCSEAQDKKTSEVTGVVCMTCGNEKTEPAKEKHLNGCHVVSQAFLCNDCIAKKKQAAAAVNAVVEEMRPLLDKLAQARREYAHYTRLSIRGGLEGGWEFNGTRKICPEPDDLVVRV